MGSMSPLHWAIVILIILLLFGGKKIPEMFSGLGKGMAEFKKAQREAEKEITDAAAPKEEAKKPAGEPEKKPS
jgi:sec-independent protein translocase protein TatA